MRTNILKIESDTAESGLKSVQVVLSELSMRLFDLVQAWMLCRYVCMCDFVVCRSEVYSVVVDDPKRLYVF